MTKRYLIFSAAFFLLALIAFIFSITLYFYSMPLTSQNYYTEVNFTDNLAGFDTNKTALIFGNVPLRGSATRLVTVSNSYDGSICVKFSVKGDIAQFILLPKEEIISSGESKTFSISVSGDEQVGQGKYIGQVNAGSYRAC